MPSSRKNVHFIGLDIENKVYATEGLWIILISKIASKCILKMLKIESYLDRSVIKWQINQYTDIWDIRPFSVTSLKYAVIIDVQLTSEVTF